MLRDEEIFHNNVFELLNFSKTYAFSSRTRPLIGRVSNKPEDLHSALNLLTVINEKIENPTQRLFVTGEILAKIIAYRDLVKGQELKIPLENSFKPFIVDEIFDLWNGMPAFGLTPEDKEDSAILLFRGTDVSLKSRRSFCSIISDLDFAGPGFSVFSKARQKIRKWLKKVKKTRTVGFSLGGVFAAYTIIYENSFISKEPSLAFNAPGVSKKVFKEWKRLQSPPPFLVFIVKRDPISKIGYLCGNVYVASLKKGPLKSHISLISAEQTYSLKKLIVK